MDDMLYLTIDEGAIKVSRMDDSNETLGHVTTREELVALLKKSGMMKDSLSFMCSSSIDFPQDETDNKDVIALCRLIRGGK